MLPIGEAHAMLHFWPELIQNRNLACVEGLILIYMDPLGVGPGKELQHMTLDFAFLLVPYAVISGWRLPYLVIESSRFRIQINQLLLLPNHQDITISSLTPTSLTRTVKTVIETITSQCSSTLVVSRLLALFFQRCIKSFYWRLAWALINYQQPNV